MKTKICISALFAVSFINAWAQDVTPPAAAQPYRYSGVVPIREFFQTSDGAKKPDNVLRVVEPNERGKDVALLVVGALMGSFRMAVPKEDYKGDNITSLLHPAGQPLLLGLMPIIEDWVKLNAADRKFANALLIRQDRFQLVYRELGQEPTIYDLKIEATLSRKPDSAGFFSAPQSFTCAWASDASASITLDDWKANDYEKVKAAQKLFVDDCLQRVNKNLNDLLAS